MNLQQKCHPLAILAVSVAVLFVLTSATTDVARAASLPAQSSGLPSSLLTVQTQISGLQSGLSALQGSVANLDVTVQEQSTVFLNDEICVSEFSNCPQGFVDTGACAFDRFGNANGKLCQREPAADPSYPPQAPAPACKEGYEPVTQFADGSPIPPPIGVCRQSIREGMRVIVIYGTRSDAGPNGISIELECPPPFVATGGGYDSHLHITENVPIPPARWRVSGRTDNSGNNFWGTLTAYAVCTQFDP